MMWLTSARHASQDRSIILYILSINAMFSWCHIKASFRLNLTLKYSCSWHDVHFQQWVYCTPFFTIQFKWNYQKRLDIFIILSKWSHERYTSLRYISLKPCWRWSWNIRGELWKYHNCSYPVFPHRQWPLMGWNYLSIPKLQRLHRWSLGMDK